MNHWRARPEAVRAQRDWGDEALVYSALDATCHLLSGLPLWLWDALAQCAPASGEVATLLVDAQQDVPSLRREDVLAALEQLAALGLVESVDNRGP